MIFFIETPDLLCIELSNCLVALHIGVYAYLVLSAYGRRIVLHIFEHTASDPYLWHGCRGVLQYARVI